MNIDRKFKILAVNPCKKGGVYTENEGIFFAAKDKALVTALLAYGDECQRIGCNQEHLESIDLLIDRVQQFQLENGSKVPDTDTDCEINRCIGGIGTND